MLPLAVAADVRVVEEIAAKVNGDIVTRGDISEKQKTLEQYLRQEQHLSGRQLSEAVQAQSRDLLRDKIDTLLLVQKAKDLNVNVDGEVARYLAQIQVASKISDPEKFKDYIRDQTQMPYEEFKQEKTNEFLVRRVVSQEVGSRISIPEAELRKFYDEHKSEFVRKDQVFLSQILISTAGKTPEQATSAEQKAKDIVARARKGEKFTDLVTANSDDPETSKNGGQMPPYGRGMLQKQIEDVVFTQKKGYITDPIKVPTGFVILKVEERYEAGLASFDEVKDQIQEVMAGPKMEPKVRTLLTRLRMEAFLEIKEGYTDSGAAPGKDTRWHDVAQLRPQTTTKEQVAAEHKRRKHILFIPIPGTTSTAGTKSNVDTSTLGERKETAPAAEAPKASKPAETPAPSENKDTGPVPVKQ